MPSQSRIVEVESLEAAQELVPFPVFVPPGSPESISVRLGTVSRWPSVRTTHRSSETSYSVKQYAMDFFGGFSGPNKLFTTTEARWASYAPITELDVGSGSAFHGQEWDGIEGASLVRLSTHVEIRVRTGRLGPRRAEQIFRDVSPLNAPDAIERASRALSVWNWSVASHDIPGSASNAERRGLLWSPGEAARGRGSGALKEARGWHLDSVARPGNGPSHVVRALWRSNDLHETLEIVRLPPGAPPSRGRSPLPPLFDESLAPAEHIRGIRSSLLRSAWYLVDRAEDSLRVVIPPSRSEPGLDARLLRELEGYLAPPVR